MAAAVSYVTTRLQASQLAVKFGFSPKVSQISNANFELWMGGATPTQVSSPFEDIDVYNDYNSLSRVLTLNVKASLTADTEYELRTVGLQNANSQNQPNDSDTFSTPEYVAPNVEPVADEVEIEDHSVKTDTVTEVDLEGGMIIVGSGGLDVLSTDPENGSYYIESDYNNGRVTLTFNSSVSSIFLTSQHFKVQRKPIQRGFVRWETIPVQLSQDTSLHQVYVDFPSNDATPIYYPEEGLYFEDQYKYRIRVLSNVSS